MRIVARDALTATRAVLEDLDADRDAMRWRPQRVICGAGQPLPVLPRAAFAAPCWLTTMAAARATHAERLGGIGRRPADIIAWAEAAFRGHQTFWWPAHHTTC